MKLPIETTPTPNPYTDGEPFLPVSQAAALAGIHARTLYRRIKAGDVPCYGYSGNYRVKLSTVLPVVAPMDIKKSRRAEATRQQHAHRSRALAVMVQ